VRRIFCNEAAKLQKKEDDIVCRMGLYIVRMKTMMGIILPKCVLIVNTGHQKIMENRSVT